MRHTINIWCGVFLLMAVIIKQAKDKFRFNLLSNLIIVDHEYCRQS
jgi:hypothetical protein